MLILLPPSERKSTEPGPAIDVYDGVLYKALGWSDMSASSQALGQASIAIISAKYGVLKPLDLIKPYKETINNTIIRPLVTAILGARNDGLVIDCRSSTYKNVWSPPFDKCVEVKVFTSQDGQKKVVTHMSKQVRGLVVRCILQSGLDLKTPEQLYDVVSQSFSCSLLPSINGQPLALEVFANPV